MGFKGATTKMIAKLAGVVFLTWWHHFLGTARKRFVAGTNPHSEKFWRMTNELPFLAAVVIVLSSVLRRNLFKYHDRGYRMVLMEAGEVAQSLALQATSLGLGTVFMGGFFDDELARLLGLDEVSEPCLLPVVVGRPGSAQ